MAQSETLTDRLVLVDIETTGLSAQLEIPLEVGLVITDVDGNVIDEFQSLIVMPNINAALAAATDYVKKMHAESGLLADLNRAQTEIVTTGYNPYMLAEVERKAVNFLKDNGIPRGSVELVGSTVNFDRAFMESYLPDLLEHFHYRNVDLSTLMVLCRKLNPELFAKFERTPGNHRVLNDINASLQLYRFMKDNFLHVSV